MNMKKIISLAAVLLAVLLTGCGAPAGSEATQPQSVTDPTEAFTVSTETIPVSVGDDAVELEEGLLVHSFRSYTGMYMEDGSDEILPRVAMVILTNNTPDDLKYAAVTVQYPGETCEYIATNVPAGTSAVLLEQNRKLLPEEEPLSTDLSQVLFFPEPMDAHADVFEITGMSGVMNVRNISDTDISGDIYVYYKYSAQDLFYGGITFRICVPGGLGAGKVYQSVTAHFDPARCTIVDIDYTAP